MSLPPFLLSEPLRALGLEHGFGTLASGGVRLPRLERVRQVHGRRMVRVPRPGAPAAADALWTREPGVAVAVRTADCVPVLLADTERRAVAAIHAGWRGSAAGIAGLAAGRLARAIGAPPARLVAVIGPHIGPCCYEVDRPVREAIAPEEVFRPGRRAGHWLLDLFSLTRLQLLAAGLRPERIHRVGGCTSCDRSRYASYRRDGSGARMLHFLRMPFS